MQTQPLGKLIRLPHGRDLLPARQPVRTEGCAHDFRSVPGARRFVQCTRCLRWSFNVKGKA